MRVIFTTFLMLTLVLAQGQSVSVSGTITDEGGEPLIGVTVVEKGTTNGTITDIDGNYQITVSGADAVLVFSSVGFSTVEQAVGSSSNVSITLSENLSQLDEIVVVGYGTQRAKDLTSSITTVQSDEITKAPVGQTMQALQGKVAGVQIVSNGAPGNEPTVRIRGVGSHPSGSDSSPLYVVDGMFFDNIDFLNTSQIESMSILKDASASAIYGVRAANGVVIITTKSGGLEQQATITYDGYVGIQVPQNVLKMANSEQFVNYVNQTGSTADIELIENAMLRYGRSRVNPNLPDVNTDWYSEIMKPAAALTSHSITVAGGNSNTTYTVGVNYFSQDGLLKRTKNSYERFNIHTKVDNYVNDWLKLGGNLNLSNGVKYTGDDGAWFRAYHAVPIMPVFDSQNEAASPVRYANAQSLGYRGSQNPFQNLRYRDYRLDIRKVLSGLYGEVDIIPNRLKFRSSYNVALEFLKERNMLLPYNLGEGTSREFSDLTSRRTTVVNQFFDNVMTYNQEIGEHSFAVMLGTSFRDESWDQLTGTASDIPAPENSWYLGQSLADIDPTADDGAERVYGLSYFGRLAYSYEDKYLAYFTLRREGTSKYQEKWGTFPAVGLGWVLSEEGFFQGVSGINFLKLRAGWGQLGNDGIQRQDGANTTNPVQLAVDDQLTSGTETTNNFGYLKWEIVTETNAGISAEFLNSRLGLEADYFVRKTEDMAIPVTNLLQSGSRLQNVGSVENRGIEVALSWNDNLTNDLSYSVGFNFATLNNEVTDLYGQEYLDAGSAEFRQRYIVGEAVASFFGLKRAGVYQTQAEVDADPIAVAEGLVPGDLKFVDQDNDGDIDGDDRVVLGSFLPDFTYGGNLGINYRNFELSVYIMGQRGNKILNRKRGEIIFTQDTNVDADLATGVWNGEGTSNTYPSAAGLRRGWNQQLSDYLIEDGSFFRIQNVQLAYNLNNKQLFGQNMPDARIYFTAEKPLTSFSYNGFNPEVADGIDRQVYPVPAVYTMGLTLKF